MTRSKKAITGTLLTVIIATTFLMYYVAGPKVSSQVTANLWDPEFNASLKWAWTGSAQYPDYDQVMMTPVVADLDLKCDRTPEIIFSTFNGSQYFKDGVLRKVDGKTGIEDISFVQRACGPPNNYRVTPAANIAVADVTNPTGMGPPDGIPEILAIEEDDNLDCYSDAILCFDCTGRPLWKSVVITDMVFYAGGIAVADLDLDGIPEIIVGNYVFDNTGTKVTGWPGTPGTGLGLSAVADLNLDGIPEVVAGCTAYDNTGGTFWDMCPLNVTDGYVGIANFDADRRPEVVLVNPSGAGRVYLLNGEDGSIKWNEPMPDGVPNKNGGPPVIGDFDGDGMPEIGVAGSYYYRVFEHDGVGKWTKPIHDWSSGRCGSSAFDFDGSGTDEIVYRDEHYLRIYKGLDGTELFRVNCSSLTATELQVIADVDNDCHAEIIQSADNCDHGVQHGIYVYENDAFWACARCIWNQHTYHITNINDDGSVPVPEANSWQIHNNYRCQWIHKCIYPCMITYRYKVKFECGWQREVIQPCTPCNVSQRIPVETLIETHINIYNPNEFWVDVKKYFVRLLPEIVETYDGYTLKNYTFPIPPNKGFEIDCVDVSTWPPDPQNPIPPLWCQQFFKGFVMIECTLPDWASPLEVVAVYNKESADMVDKITFRWWAVWCNYIDTVRGRLKLNEPLELSVSLPFEPENITIQQLVKRELGIVIPYEPEDIDVEIESTTTYFDFLECVTKERIKFTLRATEKLWEKALDEIWPDRPENWTWPACPTRQICEMKKREKFCESWQEVIVDPVANIRAYLTSALIDSGAPPEVAHEIMDVVHIVILDIDCCEGVGTSIDVEYIEPEIVDP